MSSQDDILREVFDHAERAVAEDRHAVAAELFTAYVRQRPDHAYAWYRLGDALRVIGLKHEAERALLRSLELGAKLAWVVRASLARLYTDAGELDRAEAEFAQAEADPEARATTWFWILRGANLAGAAQLSAAERCHRTATALPDGDLDEAWLNLGYVLRAQGRYAEAVEAFRRALDICPHYAQALEGLRSLDGVDEAKALIARLEGAA